MEIVLRRRTLTHFLRKYSKNHSEIHIFLSIHALKIVHTSVAGKKERKMEEAFKKKYSGIKADIRRIIIGEYLDFTPNVQ